MGMTREAVWWRGSWNAAVRGASAFGWQGADLEVDVLMARAAQETGLADFGDIDFREPLALLLRDFAAHARADATGRQVLAEMLRGALKNRLHVREALRGHPDIARTGVVAPLFIVGLPRTGTTLLQGLLAQVSGLRTPLLWETALPSALPTLSPLRELSRHKKRIENGVREANLLSPRLKTAHEFGALLPEECNPLLMTSLRALVNVFMFPCPAYAQYLYATEFRGAYGWHMPHLQLLSYRQPATTWLLKAPAHMGSLGELLRVYPDARVVFTHRDPLESVASTARLAACLHALFAPVIDYAELGPRINSTLGRMQEAAHAVRDRWPATAPRFLDIRYADLVGDPLGTVRGILRHFGIAEPEGTATLWLRYLRRNRQHRFGRHQYGLADFALVEADVRRMFAREYALLGYSG
jgi:hypothetical protein